MTFCASAHNGILFAAKLSKANPRVILKLTEEAIQKGFSCEPLLNPTPFVADKAADKLNAHHRDLRKRQN